MEFAVRSQAGRVRVVPSPHRCPQCRELALMLQHRHVSPARLGEPLVTEFYDCDSCDASFKYSPAADTWRILST
jgi:hypothetical protein